MPKKVFNYGHAVYNICIKTFRQKLKSEKHTFILPYCLLYDVNNVISSFCFIPPTASICVLCINKGGIYSIILLTFLNYINRQFQQLKCPLYNYFNYIYSISTSKEIFSVWKSIY